MVMVDAGRGADPGEGSRNFQGSCSARQTNQDGLGSDHGLPSTSQRQKQDVCVRVTYPSFKSRLCRRLRTSGVACCKHPHAVIRDQVSFNALPSMKQNKT